MEIIKIIEDTSESSSGNIKNRSGFHNSKVIEGPDTWEKKYVVFAEESGYLQFSNGPLSVQLVSKPFELDSKKLYIFRLKVNVLRAAPYAMVLVPSGRDPSVDMNWVKHRGMEQAGDHICGFSFSPNETAYFQLALINFYGSYVKGSVMAFTGFEALESSQSNLDASSAGGKGTYLPHWGLIKRKIHHACKQSRLFNAFVASIEMRLGFEEILSLPMYLALCPTGQCNALCEFCSVTIKRTGIIKKQLPTDKLQRFLEPTLNTAFMYGIEGNGEPTLYKEFNSLLEVLQAKGASTYLITNGALIEPQQISHMLTLQAITFSLNASTAVTHKKVMKLKDFSRVTDTIRSLVDQRGMNETPTIFVSFVVHATNAHELQEFLQFAEYDLRVNVIMIRPLSELGVDSGAVEDLREIVPYECQVQDALEASNEYLNDISRRRIPYTQYYCDIRIDPATFRSVRPDPVDRVVMPPGFEGLLLAPRRSGWRSLSDRVQVDWSLNQATFFCPNDEATGVVLKSVSTPVTPDSEILFRANIQLNEGAFRIDIKNDNGGLLVSNQVNASVKIQSIELKIQTGSTTRAFFEIVNLGLGFSGRIDFIRLLKPGAGIRKEFKLPFPRRWQVDTPGVKARWTGNILEISAVENLSGKYLIKSYSSPCSPNNFIKAPLNIEVTSGTLVIGVLSEDFQRWTYQFAFKTGSHQFNFEINTANNSRLQIVIFPKGGDSLNAIINWGDLLEVAPERELGLVEELIDLPEIELVSNEPKSSTQSDAVKRSEIASQQKTPKVKKIKYYCQKPWTDVNNFTVDGRMDVCCITTGSSQDHYSLGNILEQDFQEIWNGAQMKKFRKTVNSNEPLPPCQRCPMAYSYQGPFFDRGVTEAKLKHSLINNMQKRNFVLRSIAFISYMVIMRLNPLFFWGFKK